MKVFIPIGASLAVLVTFARADETATQPAVAVDQFGEDDRPEVVSQVSDASTSSVLDRPYEQYLHDAAAFTTTGAPPQLTPQTPQSYPHPETPQNYQYPSPLDYYPQLQPQYQTPQYSPQPQPSQYYPQPQLSQYYPQPQLSQYYPQPQLSQYYPQPQLSQYYPQPQLSQYYPQPQLSQSYQPQLSQYYPQPQPSQYYPQPLSPQYYPQLETQQSGPYIPEDKSEPQPLNQSPDTQPAETAEPVTATNTSPDLQNPPYPLSEKEGAPQESETKLGAPTITTTTTAAAAISEVDSTTILTTELAAEQGSNELAADS